VFVMNVDSSSPELGQRTPVDVRFAEDGGPFMSEPLVALPYPGIPLAPSTLAAVVTTRVRGADGSPLEATAARPS
jgi:hypothetical protein